jgi:hypothetical protein
VGPPPYVDHQDDELFLVLRGELSFLTPTGWVKTTPGTAVYIPRGVVHTFRNTGATPSRHWALTSPSGFERFYTKAAEMFASGAANPDRLQSRAQEYGLRGPAARGLPTAGHQPLMEPGCLDLRTHCQAYLQEDS